MQYKHALKYFLISYLLIPAYLFSANTGKIAGKVLDEKTNEPLIGVNILIEGTRMGAATGAEGEYSILQVPPGIYSISSSYIGYAKLITENVRVSSDLTTKLDFNMKASAVEGDLITVTAEKALFERGATNEVRIIQSDQIQNLPIRGYSNVAAMQTGVVVDDDEGMHVRGGRSDETAFYVDGVYMNNPYDLGRSGDVPTLAMEEISMQIGGFGAEYGDANAGIVNVTTKTGGEKIKFSMEAFSDGFLPSTPTVEDEKPFAYSYGDNLFSGTIGGPIPGLNFIRYFGSLEHKTMSDADPSSGSFAIYDGELSDNGIPVNGEVFTDNNGNGVYDSGEEYVDSDLNGQYQPYLAIHDSLIKFVHGPKADNFLNQQSFNGNLLFDLQPLTGLAWKLKFGGSYYNRKSADYFHSRGLFAFYNDASDEDSWNVTGDLKHRYNVSESTTNSSLIKLHGNIPTFDKMFFNLQFSQFSDTYENYDPVLKEGFGNFIYDDGSVSDFEIPYIQIGKRADYSNPQWIYTDSTFTYSESDSTLNTSSFDYWNDDESLTYISTNYNDTAWINPMYSSAGSMPALYAQIANYTPVGYNSGDYEKEQSQHNTLKGSLTWQLGDHELKTGVELRNNTIRYYRIGAAERLAYYFDVNAPYAPDQDRNGYVDSLGVVIANNPDGISDYLQDGSDSWNPLNSDGDPYFGSDGIYGTDDDLDGATEVAYSEYWDNHLFQGLKGSYAENVGFDITGQEQVDSGLDGARKPIMGAWYAQDKFELDDLIMTLGLRFDYINPNTKIFNPLTGGNTNIIINDAGTIAETVYWDDANGDGVTETYEYTSDKPTDEDADGLPHRIDAEVNKLWSPRIGMAFPVTDKTVFHAQYGKYVQQPELNRLFISYTRFLSNLQQGNYTTSQNPELKPVKTTAYELGFKQLLTDAISIDATVFYKQMTDYVQIRNISANPTGYALFVNGDYGSVKGLSLSLHTRRLNKIQIDANYTLQYAGGTGSNSDGQYTIAWLGGNFPTFVSPLDFDQRHTGNISFDYRIGSEGYILKNSGFNLLFRYGSGLRYTPSKPRSEVFGGSLAYQPTAALNSGVMPSVVNVDLKFEKVFNVSQWKFRTYLWIENLLDKENAVAVYNSTGLPNNDGYLTTAGGEAWLEDAIGDDPKFASQLYESRVANINNYGSPRQIRLGLRIDL